MDSQRQQSEERAEFRKLLEQRLTEQEFRDLEQRLLADRGLRERYLKFVDLEANLYAEFESRTSVLPEESKPVIAGLRSGHRRWLPWAVAASLLCAILLLARPASSPRSSPEPEVAITNPVFTAISTPPPSEIAVVTFVSEDVPPQEARQLQPGLRLRPGTLHLSQGELEIEFFSGTQLVLQGPAELQMVSATVANLVSGKAAARVLEWGKGFALNSPDAAFVDMGTEFTLNVDPSRGSELVVVEGEVEISLLDEQGSTRISERAREQSALLVAPGAGHIEHSEQPTPQMPRFRERTLQPLPVTQEYVDTVIASRPVIYWRFESVDDSLSVPNEMGPDWSGEIRYEGDQVAGLQVENGMLRFRHAPQARWLATSEAIPHLNAESFTIEMWVNPDMLHWATLLGVVPDGEQLPVNHLNVIELAHLTALRHVPGAFRFLHRHPPDRNGGINLFTPDGCTPGQWHYLVAVKTPNELQFYFNGELLRSHEGPMEHDEIAYQLMLGQLRTESNYRQFSGALDEFAVHTRALSPSEIRARYELIGKQQTR